MSVAAILATIGACVHSYVIRALLSASSVFMVRFALMRGGDAMCNATVNWSPLRRLVRMINGVS